MQADRLGRVVCALMVGSSLAATGFAQGAIERVSVPASGPQGNGPSQFGAVSADGRYVVFESDASNLVPGDTNAASDIFLRDRLFGATECLSRPASGAVANGGSNRPALSDDARIVAFVSTANDLAAGDVEVPGTLNSADVFVLDRSTGSIQLISRRVSGAQATAHFETPAVSGDGSTVVFGSSIDLATGADSVEVWAYDVASGALGRVDGGAATPFARYPSISHDGRFVSYRAWVTLPSGLLTRQILVRDRVAASTQYASLFANGALGNADSSWSSISADGRFVAFDSLATNDVPSSGAGVTRVYVRDLASGTTELVSVNSLGQPNIAACNTPVLSPDGRRVAFYSNGSDWIPGDTSAAADAVVFDRTTRALIALGTSAAGSQTLSASAITAFRADGAQVVLISASGNLVPGDTNGHFDVFLKDVTPLIPAPYCTAQVNSLGCTSNLTSSGLPSASSSSAFLVEARELINRRHAVLFYGFAPNAVPFNGGTLCIAAPLKRTAVQPTGGSATGIDCTGAIAFDFNALIRSGNVPELVVGTVVYAQVTYGDVGGAFGRAQSDGLTFTVLP
jgi:Tol biopolymer transport system component